MTQRQTRLDMMYAMTHEPPDMDFVLPGLLRGTVGAIVAPGSVGKGFFALELCTLISSMGDFNLLGFDLPNSNTYKRQYPDDVVFTMFVTAEDPLDILHLRVFNIAKHINPQLRERIACTMETISVFGMSPHLVDKNGDRQEAWISALKRGFCGKDLCIIDTLSLFHNGTENDETNMKLLIEILKEIAAECNTAILFTHHVPKGEYGDDEPVSRGSSVLVNNIRWQLNLRKMTINESDNKYNSEKPWLWVKVMGTKINYAAKPENGEDIWLKRDVETGVLLRAEPERKYDKGGSNGRKTA